MGALDTLLKYKMQKDAEADAQFQAIPQAMMMYQQAKDNQANRFLQNLQAQDMISKIQERKSSSDFLSQFMSGSGGNLPPGTTAKIGDLTIPLTREYTEGEAKTLSTSESLMSQINDLKSLIQSDQDKYAKNKIGGFLGSSQLLGQVGPVGVGEQGQDYRLLKDSISERLLRLRSGAQINESEYKRFIKMLPSIFRNDSLDIKQLDNFYSEFQAIEGRIKSGSLWDEKSGAFKKAESKSNDSQETRVVNGNTYIKKEDGLWYKKA